LDVFTVFAIYIRYLFSNFQYESAKGKKMIPIDLVQETSKELTEYFDAKQSAKLKYFIKVISLRLL